MISTDMPIAIIIQLTIETKKSINNTNIPSRGLSGLITSFSYTELLLSSFLVFLIKVSGTESFTRECLEIELLEYSLSSCNTLGL